MTTESIDDFTFDPTPIREAAAAIREYGTLIEEGMGRIREYREYVEREEERMATATPNFEAQMSAANIYAVTDNGRGFLPPLMRAYGHILYLAGRQAESPTRKPTDEEALAEFSHGLLHFAEVNTQNLSTESVNKLNAAHTAWITAQQEVVGWSAAERETNFIKLANLLVHVMTKLDRELLGLRDSDIGAFL